MVQLLRPTHPLSWRKAPRRRQSAGCVLREDRSPQGDTRGIVIAGYLAIVAVAIISEVYAQRKPNNFAPIGDMLEHVMTSRTTRVSVIAAWWWFGWHFAFADTVQLEL